MTGGAPRVWGAKGGIQRGRQVTLTPFQAIAPRPLPRPACTARALWIPAGAGMTEATPRVWGAKGGIQGGRQVTLAPFQAIAHRTLPHTVCTARALWIPVGAGMTGAVPRVWGAKGGIQGGRDVTLTPFQAIALRPLPRPACTARALWVPAGAGMTGAAPRVWGARRGIQGGRQVTLPPFQAIAPRPLPRPASGAPGEVPALRAR